VCVQEKQSAVLKLLAANGATALNSGADVVVVAGERQCGYLLLQLAALLTEGYS